MVPGALLLYKGRAFMGRVLKGCGAVPLQAQRVLKEVHLPNSYTLTKHMCEDLLAELHCETFPVCINRPTIIGAIANLPVPGYFGNAAGLTSATLAFATGTALFMQQILTLSADVSDAAQTCGNCLLTSCLLSTADVEKHRLREERERVCVGKGVCMQR